MMKVRGSLVCAAMIKTNVVMIKVSATMINARAAMIKARASLMRRARIDRQKGFQTAL